MTSQPKAKGEMYILNDGMNMKAKIAAMERRLEELEMNQMQEVQAISQTPLQAMPCAICRSYEHLWRVSYHSSREGNPPQYKQHVQALPQASSLEQAMVNLSKMDEVQNDLSQKLDILQDSISRFANLNTMQEKENSPSQPYQNSKGIHVVEAQEEESSMEKEVKTLSL
ncbi:hypothetical protein CK203_065741 [Vitis vinifera]|uniref:Uncharacterized protein n=1 Tax=Vitis vinifera TaxID=29760 RepID=A0A438G3C9_VITVI|nr:hypothetical protein CK203_065741 [Vitis vinifera]